LLRSSVSLAALLAVTRPTTVPSGFAFFTNSAATTPPAPGRFSMITGAPRSCASLSEASRAAMSVLPPGGPPTTMRTGVCAAAVSETAAAIAASRDASRREVMSGSSSMS